MTDDAVRTALDALAAETIGWEGPLPDGDLSEHLDSMNRLALVVAIEDHFAIAFDVEDDDGARTIADVVAIVQRKLAEDGRG